MSQWEGPRRGEDDADGGRRRVLPALVMVAVPAIAAALVWGNILRAEVTTGRDTCPPPPKEAALTPLPPDEALTVDPLPPAQVAVLVRNSTAQARLASRVAAHLELLGFTKAAPPDNDPVYPTGTMSCVAQIRFGDKGSAAARTLGLVAPCAQLVRDDRADSTADLVLGTDFVELAPSPPAHEALRHLREAQQQTVGGLQSVPDGSGALPRSILTQADAEAEATVC